MTPDEITALQTEAASLLALAEGLHEDPSGEDFARLRARLGRLNAIVGRLDGPAIGSVEATRAEIGLLVESDSPQMAFQPIFSLGGRSVPIAWEALARFSSDRSPAAWFEAARSVGMLDALELAALKAALRALPSLGEQAYLSVNISVPTLTSPELPIVLQRVPTDRLVFEVQEDDALAAYGPVRDAFYGLRALGYRIAIDDVGSDEVRLSRLAKLHPDIIKLDVALVAEIDDEPGSGALVAAVLGFAEQMGAAVVAEGIERPAQLDRLIDLGVRYGQGFHLGMPAPLSEVAALSA